MFSQFVFFKSSQCSLRRVYSDLSLFSQPVELLAMLCRLDRAAAQPSSGVSLGDQVLLESLSDGQRLSFKLVMPGVSADAALSVFSPLGRAVYQLEQGQDCHVLLGRQRLSFRVIHIYKSADKGELANAVASAPQTVN